MVFQLSKNRIIRISPDVLETFRNHRQVSFKDSESGGILLGFVFDDYILINKATTPNKSDRQGPYIFHRHKGRAQKIVDQTFIESQGRQIYMGEWHTHRQRYPKPSIKDKIEIKRAYKKSKLNLNFIILIIVGNEDKLGNIWFGCQSEIGLKRCNHINT